MAEQRLPPLLSWAPTPNAIRCVALFLNFPATTRGPTAPGEASLLHFTRTCHTVHAVLTSDARCWASQRLHFDLHEPILHPLDFVQLPRAADADGPDTTRAIDQRRLVRADSFPVRRQEIMRRLIGNAAFERHIAPRLVHTRVVVPTDATWTTYELDEYADDDQLLARRTAEAESGQSVAVYSQLHVGIFTESVVQRRRLAASEELDTLQSYRFYGFWVYGCYSSLLLPSVVRLISAARVSFRQSLFHDSPLHLDCLYRLLDGLPGLTSLQLEQPAMNDEELEGPLFSWPVIHRLLPALRHLTVKGAAMQWESTLRSFLTLDGCSLVSFEVDTDRVFTLGR